MKMKDETGMACVQNSVKTMKEKGHFEDQCGALPNSNERSGSSEGVEFLEHMAAISFSRRTMLQ
jgi:hypothetical protein